MDQQQQQHTPVLAPARIPAPGDTVWWPDRNGSPITGVVVEANAVVATVQSPSARHTLTVPTALCRISGPGARITVTPDGWRWV